MLFTGIQNSRGGRSPIGSPGINSLDQLAGKIFRPTLCAYDPEPKRAPINHFLGIFTLAQQSCPLINGGLF